VISCVLGLRSAAWLSALWDWSNAAYVAACWACAIAAANSLRARFAFPASAWQRSPQALAGTKDERNEVLDIFTG
jgi:hypothetical protein